LIKTCVPEKKKCVDEDLGSVPMKKKCVTFGDFDTNILLGNNNS